MKKLILLTLLLSGCSSGQLIKMAQRKCPECFKDSTRVKYDTLVHSTSKDTSFQYNSSKDTIYIKTKGLKEYYFYNTTTHSVSIGGTCRDSIINTTKIINHTITIKPTFWDSIKEYGWIFIILLGICILIFIFKK